MPVKKHKPKTARLRLESLLKRFSDYQGICDRLQASCGATAKDVIKQSGKRQNAIAREMEISPAYLSDLILLKRDWSIELLGRLISTIK